MTLYVANKFRPWVLEMNKNCTKKYKDLQYRIQKLSVMDPVFEFTKNL